MFYIMFFGIFEQENAKASHSIGIDNTVDSIIESHMQSAGTFPYFIKLLQIFLCNTDLFWVDFRV